MRCSVRLKPPHTLTVDGQRYSLTLGQYNVLMTLMSYQVCSLDMLIDAVYPPAAMRPLSERGVVYTHIYDLRRILDGHWQILNRQRIGWYLDREKTDG